jgi:hypothetical protein
MDEPQRLLDGTGTPLERTLLQELQSYQGPKSMRAHTLAALGGTGSTGLAAVGFLAWLWGKTWSTKLLLTVSVTSDLLSIPASYLILRHSSTSPALPASPTVTASPRVQQLPSIAPASPTTSSPALDIPADPTPAPVARLSRRGLTASADLRAELGALDTVRATLARSDFPVALSLLDAYFQRFHHGRLHLEAEILRIDALAKCGQTTAARSYAKEFLRRHPTSVHAARLQSIVGH